MPYYVIDCNNPRWFWMSWGNGSAQCGNGNNPGSDVFLQYTYPNPPLTIRGAGVAIYQTNVNFSVYDSKLTKYIFELVI